MWLPPSTSPSIRLQRSTLGRVRSPRSSVLGLARRGICWFSFSSRGLLKVFPVGGGILQNPLGDLEVRRVLQGDGMQSITVQRENLRAGKRQENRRMRGD